ncbi:MAG: ABC transporter ATP-binding protein [Gemmatimonadota bacterium]
MSGERRDDRRSELQREVLDELRRELRADDSPGLADAETVIELCDVRLGYGAAPVLDGISLELHRGETMCILGGSGAGKSTILRLILGLSYPDEGRILVSGTDIAHASLDSVLALRRKMGMVFQGAALFDSLPVYENVAFYLHEHTRLDEATIGERVREALRFVDLDPEAVEDLLPAELSGGMRKRVGIARAIIHRPEILLYDEPTSGLDPITTHTINELIRKMQRELAVSSVVVTHDIRSAFRIGNRVALLSGGHIVFMGGPEEMVAAEDEYVREFLR